MRGGVSRGSGQTAAPFIWGTLSNLQVRNRRRLQEIKGLPTAASPRATKGTDIVNTAL